MHYARIDFGEIDLSRPISPKSALRNASQRCLSGPDDAKRAISSHVNSSGLEPGTSNPQARSPGNAFSLNLIRLVEWAVRS